MTTQGTIRRDIRQKHMGDELAILRELIDGAGPSDQVKKDACVEAERLIETVRSAGKPGLMEVFLAEYGLSSQEGIALMCLAEALLRVPDAETIDDLIEDKIASSSWSKHLGHSSSPLVNASTWALMLTGKVLQDRDDERLVDTLHGMVKRLGEPVIRTAVRRAMKEMGNQFVLGETIDDAIRRGHDEQQQGFTYSYDMLGEAAMTAEDAQNFFDAYASAISALGKHSTTKDVRDNPGISVKLSALHPRYEQPKKQRAMDELVPRLRALCLMAKERNMGLNIDAEEADRLDLSLDVIEAVLRSPDLAGWHGFGVVVQAYGKRALPVIDWLHALTVELDRRIMVRLVKGAYWDTEIKLAQVNGVDDFPVFTSKSATDVSYICCANKLLKLRDRIYPQFATHNAHTVSAILALAGDINGFEFQRLHGMGETLHRIVMEDRKTRCRIYAPVGPHRDLLAYLVRRLLENGANSSFVNQIVDLNTSAAVIAEDPFSKIGTPPENLATLKRPGDLFVPERQNSKGWNLLDPHTVEAFEKARAKFSNHQWHVAPTIAGSETCQSASPVFSPADRSHQVGSVSLADQDQLDAALLSARDWSDCTAKKRAEVLQRASELYESNAGEIFAALTREAGKTAADAVAEIREAVDFLRYYGARGVELEGSSPRGLVACISPWNFPLAIFSGQIAAALSAGNGVLAKPAEATPIVASIGVRLLHQAGVPKDVLQLIPGPGSIVGAKITTDKRVSGVCFTGSTETAQRIHRNLAEYLAPDAMFIAETGGLNAMIVDSTALPEQSVRDILISAFQSAGQRCSALRILYVQEDIAENFLKMLFGAMDELKVGDPWKLDTDVGPVINEAAHQSISDYIEGAKREGRLLKQIATPGEGLYVGPAVLKVGGIEDMDREIFGPVLHVARFSANRVDQVVDDINGKNFGLTFGLHTRIDDRVEHITGNIKAGNLYVNRNQIGAIVGSQPFGGEGLSGTGPKAGGPNYVPRFTKRPLPLIAGNGSHSPMSLSEVQTALDEIGQPEETALQALDLPGPTGEANRLSIMPRGTVLCLGPSPEDAKRQAEIASEMGCRCLVVVPEAMPNLGLDGYLPRALLTRLIGFDAVALWSDEEDLRSARKALAAREGPILPLIATTDMADYCILERHICIDTTAAGGNAALLSMQ